MSNTKPRKPTKSQWPQWATSCFWCDKNQVWAYKDAMDLVRGENGRYLKGYKGGNPNGTSAEVAKRIQNIRSLSTEAILNHGLPRLIKFLTHEKKVSARDLVAIVRLLADIGIPQLKDEEDAEGVKLPQIVISQEAIDKAIEADKVYQDQDSNKPEE